MLIYHSPLVKGKTRKRKTGGAGTLCGLLAGKAQPHA